MMNKLLTVVATVALAMSAQAAELKADESLQKMGMKQGRDFHQMNYDEGCKSCHDQGLKNRPSDEACSTCHDVDELAVATARTGDEVHQNPHDNLHYGKEVPCTECHGEHEAKAPICSDCHTFKFDKHKQ